MSLLHLSIWFILGFTGALLLTISLNRRFGKAALSVGDLLYSLFLSFGGIVTVIIAVLYISNWYVGNKFRRILNIPLIK